MKSIKTIDKQDNKPILYIETNLGEEIVYPNIINTTYKEIEKYSITPTTFESRRLEKILDFSADQNVYHHFDQQKSKVQEKLNTAQAVLETQMGEFTQLLEKSVSAKLITQAQQQEFLAKDPLYLAYKTRRDELNQYQDKIKVLDSITYPDFAIFLDHYSNKSSNEVFRYGLNSSALIETVKSYNTLQPKISAPSQKSGKSNKTELPKTILHPLEMIIINKALSDLTAQKQTVLIDIFARDDKEQIRFDEKTNLPETHTVVLYKNDDSNIIVIDPSNSTFSKYLASEISNLLVKVELMDQTLKAFTNELKIYTPSKNIGPNPEQYRDCIDIAVKIAFGLNNHKGVVDVSKIMELPAIKEITNQKLINEAFVSEYGVVRIRQASEDKIRTIADKITDKLDQQRQSLSKYKNSGNMMEQILQKDIDSFKTPYTSDKYKEGLQTLVTTFNNNESLINDFIRQDISLLGEEINTID